jgi:uncharacterized membrane protein
VVLWILIPCAIATAAGLFLLWPGKPHVSTTQQTAGSQTQRAYGDVVQITTEACPASLALVGPTLPCGTAVVHVTSGQGTGQNVSMDMPQGPGAPTIAVGDQVVLSVQDAGAGKLVYSVMDRQRGRSLLLMLGLCALVVIVIGRWQGVAALIALGASFAGLLFFIIPAVLNGASPLPVAIVGASAIMFVMLYLTHGISMQTSVAVLGTLVSLVVTGLLGTLFTVSAALTGFGSEESLYVSILNGNVDMQGLLLAGIIIGALGVLNDVTITQATTVAELAPTATSRAELFRAGMRVGRAHIASAVNTIIMAYAGESLPLLLLITASGQKVSDLLTGQYLAQELVRAAVGTLGLVAAVPITTGLAAMVAQLRRPAPARALAHDRG